MRQIAYIGILSCSILALAGCQRFKIAPTEVTTDSVESFPTDSTVIPENQGIIPDSAPQVITGGYLDYDSKTIAQLAQNGKTVLFFHAAVCPECSVINDEINARIFDLPADLNIIKVDFDTQTELKQKYDVTHENTFVLIDENLAAVEKWNGGDLDQVLSKVQ